MKIRIDKKDILPVIIAAFLGLILGAYLHTFTKPQYNVLWEIKSINEVHNELKDRFLIIELLTKYELEGQGISSQSKILFNKMSEYIETYNLDNPKFNSIENISFRATQLIYSTSDKNKSEKDIKIYVENLNKFVTNKMLLIIQKYIEISKKKITDNYNLNIKKTEQIIDVLTNNTNNNQAIYENLKTHIQKEFKINSTIIEKNNLDNLIIQLKNPYLIKNQINSNRFIKNMKIFHDILKLNNNFIKLVKIKKIINRQPTQLFYSFSMMMLMTIISLVVIGIKKMKINKI